MGPSMALRARISWGRGALVVAAFLWGSVSTVALPAGAADLAPAAVGGPPYGNVDMMRVTAAGNVEITGWAADDDAGTAPIAVHVYDGADFIGFALAAGPRPDVAAVYPQVGANHGFFLSAPVPVVGLHHICVYAINAGPPTENPLLGCRDLWAHSPFGSLDLAVRDPDGIRLIGWADDSDAETPTYLSVQIGGIWYGPFAADRYRPDVDAAYARGSAHGFDLKLPLLPVGVYTACIQGLNVGPGEARMIGCRAFEVSSTPRGYLDVLRGGDGFARLAGWAFDPDSPAPVTIQIVADGQLVYEVGAMEPRPDIAALFPGEGPNHGFHFDVGLHPGQHTLCAYATGIPPGPPNVLLGCAVLSPPPPGSGAGRRVVYDNLGQQLWLVDADGLVERTYRVSGRYRDPGPGVYYIYAWQRYADAGHDGITMEYFVAFNPAGVGYGFHTIPVTASGTPLQGEDELGQFRSAGCVRQRREDAIYLWNWARPGDPVVVL
jgi:hypothetical protein